MPLQSRPNRRGKVLWRFTALFVAARLDSNVKGLEKYMGSETFHNLATGINALIVSAALGVSGFWAYHTFDVLGKTEKAKAELQELQQKIRGFAGTARGTGFSRSIRRLGFFRRFSSNSQ